MPIFDFPPTRSVGAFSRQVLEARRFYLGPFIGRAAPVVVAGGFERVSRDYAVERGTTPFVAIELVVAGEGVATLRGRPFRLVPGTLFVYGPRTPHRLTTAADRPLNKYFLELDGPRGRPLLRTHGLSVGRALQLRNWIDPARLFDEIVHHGTGPGTNRQTVCDTLLQALLLVTAETRLPQEQAGDALRSYQHVCTLIETAHLRLRTLADLATAARLDAAYVCRLFRRYDTQTPYQRLLRRRMTAAATRLYDGTTSVGRVAAALGYSDQFHFSRAFKAVLGVPPARFRRAPVRTNAKGDGE